MTGRAGAAARDRRRRSPGLRLPRLRLPGPCPSRLCPSRLSLPRSFAALFLALSFGLPASVAAAPGGGQETSQIRLLGLMRQGERAVALLQFGPRRPERLLLGETGRGWTLVGVEADSVRLESSSGRTVEIPLREAVETSASAGMAETETSPESAAAAIAEDPKPAPEATAALPAEESLAEPEIPPPPVPDPAANDPAAPSPGGVTGGERRFSRDEVRLRLATELPRILTGATVLPRIRGDEVVGLELVSFPPDTILGETGLQPNDVLLRVNDREVRGVESLAILAQRFQTANRLELAVERNGEVVSLRYTIE